MHMDASIAWHIVSLRLAIVRMVSSFMEWKEYPKRRRCFEFIMSVNIPFFHMFLFCLDRPALFCIWSCFTFSHLRCYVFHRRDHLGASVPPSPQRHEWCLTNGHHLLFHGPRTVILEWSSLMGVPDHHCNFSFWCAIRIKHLIIWFKYVVCSARFLDDDPSRGLFTRGELPHKLLDYLITSTFFFVYTLMMIFGQ